MNLFASLIFACLASGGPGTGSTALDPRLGHVYEVRSQSQVEEGCFDLCDCPIVLHGGLAGGFVLYPLQPEGTFQLFSLRQVKWVYPSAFGGSTTFVTGSGTWRIDRAAGVQRLDLSLAVGSAAPAPYGSGLVPLTVEFPELAVPIERIGEFCFETHFDLVAQPREPVPPPGFPSTGPAVRIDGASTPPCSWGLLKSNFEASR